MNNITLAQFLGWEEDTEYKYMENIYKVKDDTLYRFSYKNNRFKAVSYTHLTLPTTPYV